MEPALARLVEVSGVRLDPYGTARLSPDHAGLLAQELLDRNTASTGNTELLELIRLLERSSEDGVWILVEGD